MAQVIRRVGVYVFPPVELKRIIEATWAGKLNESDVCRLIYQHAGECPIWGAHITLLDAIAIIDDDFAEFARTMGEVLGRHLPISVGHPFLTTWGGDNVFLRWNDELGREKLKTLRVELAAAAQPFAVTERLDWEKVNDVERLLDAHGIERAPAKEFRSGLEMLKQDMLERWPILLHAPNVPLEWYAEPRTKKPLQDGKMPFSLSAHMSIASAVRSDAETGMSAREVGEYIVRNLPDHRDFKPVLDPTVTHVFDTAYLVEPLPPDKAIEITVLDRVTKSPRKERRQPWVETLELCRSRAPHVEKKVVVDFWTRWPVTYGKVTVEMLPEVAREVVNKCREFARVSLNGALPSALFLLKTTGEGAHDPETYRLEEAAWRKAVGTDVEFQYLAGSLPVCSGWDVCWHASRWWEKGDILAFPTMDFIDAMLSDRYRITSLDSLGENVRNSLLAAPIHFGEMLDRAEETKGLIIGGYRTCDHYPHYLVEQQKHDRMRRGGLSAKDLLEAAFRCHASGVFRDYEPFQKLLSRYPDLRVRSEIIVMHRECWEKLMRARRLQIEPFEATLQLILGALLEGCVVEQVDFGWLLEEGRKPDTTMVTQIKRGIQTIERLRHFWF